MGPGGDVNKVDGPSAGDGDGGGEREKSGARGMPDPVGGLMIVRSRTGHGPLASSWETGSKEVVQDALGRRVSDRVGRLVGRPRELPTAKGPKAPKRAQNVNRVCPLPIVPTALAINADL